MDKTRTDNILVFIETDHGQISDVSLELICKANKLSKTLGVSVQSLLVGSGVDHSADNIFQYGCQTLFIIDDKRLEFYETLPYSIAVAHVIEKAKPQIVLFGATPLGRDLAPRVASKLKTGLTADCTDLQIGDHEDKKLNRTYKQILYQIRPAFGGNIIATIIAPEHRPQISTVREGVMTLDEPIYDPNGEIIHIDIQLDNELFVNHVVERVVGEKRINLKKADIIVSGGAGLGDKKSFQMIWDLAHTLGGNVGASRAAVDNGFISHEHQVGQTGTTVRPKLYIACGISGAIQHREGMKESGKIIAINSDPTAPIFDIAHYGIVGDVNDVIPMMIKAYKTKK